MACHTILAQIHLVLDLPSDKQNWETTGFHRLAFCAGQTGFLGGGLCVTPKNQIQTLLLNPYWMICAKYFSVSSKKRIHNQEF
ncbi:unnamed protein product [Danaus chrysippus]|uniref:(African queen) hypothetical protein n=1 Tax=Danaus chrysippus TaxID=151541 RepID=A0A8J2QJ92_9NEOP|nr:unnamed protein product [Danaus chrysippus]